MDRYKIGSGTLSLIMERYHAGGIPIEELQMMPPKEVELLFYPQKNIKKKDIPLPDFQYYYDRIHAISTIFGVELLKKKNILKISEEKINEIGNESIMEFAILFLKDYNLDKTKLLSDFDETYDKYLKFLKDIELDKYKILELRR